MTNFLPLGWLQIISIKYCQNCSGIRSPLLLNQLATAGRVNILVATNQTDKTKSIIETELFGKPKTVHLAIIGCGNVGATLVEQILDSAHDILQRKRIDLKIIAIANSKNIILNKNGFGSDWRQK